MQDALATATSNLALQMSVENSSSYGLELTVRITVKQLTRKCLRMKPALPPNSAEARNGFFSLFAHLIVLDRTSASPQGADVKADANQSGASQTGACVRHAGEPLCRHPSNRPGL